MSDTSYSIEVQRINEVLNKDTKLHVLVFDINNLKIINDKYGHEYGNKLIIGAADTITKIFNKDNTYRIGGDEFVIIVENQTDEAIEKSLNEYNDLVKDCYLELPDMKHNIVIAYGYTKFDNSMDTCFEDVFNRADSLMYKHKRQLKENKGS